MSVHVSCRHMGRPAAGNTEGAPQATVVRFRRPGPQPDLQLWQVHCCRLHREGELAAGLQDGHHLLQLLLVACGAGAGVRGRRDDASWVGGGDGLLATAAVWNGGSQDPMLRFRISRSCRTSGEVNCRWWRCDRHRCTAWESICCQATLVSISGSERGKSDGAGAQGAGHASSVKAVAVGRAVELQHCVRCAGALCNRKICLG